MQAELNAIRDKISGVWRFRWTALIVAWTVAALGWVVLMFWPDMYQANARVFVDTRTALKPVLQGLAVEQDVNTQLNYVRQSLLGRPQLEKIANDTGLVPATVTDPRQRAQAIDDMRSHIVITVKSAAEGAGERDTGGSIYGLVYKDNTRDRSLKVVGALLQTLVEDTLGGKRQGSQNAQKFLETQIGEYELRLRAAENRLAEFKKTNVGVMPTEQGGYFTRLQTELDAVRTGESALAVATSRREAIETQLHGESAVTASTISMPAVNGQTAAASDLQTRIRETQAKLDELLLKFTEKHPDVAATRQTLEELKRRREEEIASLRRGDANAVASSGASANPVFQSIQLALNQVDVEIATLKRQLEDHRSRVKELRVALDTMPQVEAEYAQLNRDYEVNKTQFTALLTQLEKAKLGQEADTSGSVRFEIIEPPTAAYQPASPNRALLIVGILAAALVAGVGVAYLLSLSKPVFWSTKMLRERTGLVVLGVVSSAIPQQLLRRTRRGALWFATAGMCLVIAAAVTFRFSQLGMRFTLPRIG